LNGRIGKAMSEFLFQKIQCFLTSLWWILEANESQNYSTLKLL
jgi:hypothetical protein